MEENFIPRKLQEEKILFWHKNEFIIFVACFGCGMAFRHLLIGILAGFFFIKLLKKLNKSGRQCFVRGFFYWHLPMSLCHFRKTPPSHLRTFIK